MRKFGVDATRAPRAPVSLDCTVMGTHPLASHYRSKTASLAGTFGGLGKVLPKGAQLRVKHFIVKDDQAVVELHSGATAKNRMRFDNRYCWVVYFRDNVIVHARAYLDSAMVARLFAENSMFGCAWPRIDPTT